MAAIPANLEPEVLAKAGEGWTTRRIAEWLHTDRSVKTSHRTVATVLIRLRKDRADVAKAVLRTKLASTLTSDLDRIEKHAAQLDELADEQLKAARDGIAFARKGGGENTLYVEPGESYAKLVEQVRKITETKLKYSGAEQPDENTPRPMIIIPPESED
jgi:hypothetical protein